MAPAMAREAAAAAVAVVAAAAAPVETVVKGIVSPVVMAGASRWQKVRRNIVFFFLSFINQWPRTAVEQLVQDISSVMR